MSKIIDRTGKGSNISQSENDANLDSLHGINQGIAGATHTVDITDQGDTLEFTNGGAVAVTLDSIATIAAVAHTTSFHVTLVAIGTGTVVTITPDALNTINTGVSTIVLAENEYVTLETDSTNLIWNIKGFNRLDGLKGSQFLRSDANDTATGDLTLSGAVDFTGTLEIGSVQVTSTAAELNILDGVTSTAAELNILDGVTSTAAELNILDGVTSTTAELNILDGVTKTAAQINATQDQVVPATTNNLAMLDASGDLADSLVESDGAGNITANVTGDVSGNATTATTAVNVSGTAVIDETNMAANSVNTNELIADSVTAGILASSTAGASIIKRVLGVDVVSTTDTSYPGLGVYLTTGATVLLGTCLVPGTVRINYDLKTNSPATASARIKINGVQVDEQTTISSTFVTKAYDASVVVGDIIVLQIKTSGGSFPATVSVVNISSSASNMAIS